MNENQRMIERPPSKNRNATRAIIVAALLLAAACGGAWWYTQHGMTGEDGLTAAQRREVTEAVDAAADYIQHDKIPEARVILEKLLGKFPEHAEANHLMAQVDLVQERTLDAFEHLNRSIAADPDQPEVRFSAGVLAQKLNKPDEAQSHYEAAAALEPGSAKFPLYLAQLHLKAERLDAAEAELDKAKALDPTLPQVYGLLAQLAEKRGRHDAALTHVNKALEQLKPGDDSYESYTLLKALTLRKRGDSAAALDVLRALPPEKQQEPAIVQHFAECYMALGEPGKAAGVWSELFALEPWNAQAAAHAGLCIVEQDSRKARQFLSLAERIDRRDPVVQQLAAKINAARQ